MDTVCPECQHPQSISTKRLKKKQGQISCTQCGHIFHPNQITQKPADSEQTTTEIYAWQKPHIPHTRSWLSGSLLACLLFAFQIIYFTGYPISQTAQLRPWLNIISQKLNITLPVYRNLSEFTTIGSAFDHLHASNYRLQVSFINQANFAQSLPKIQLTLHNYNGGMLAQRVFTPEEYLQSKPANMLIKSLATIDIDLYIAVPDEEVAGYSIELI